MDSGDNLISVSIFKKNGGQEQNVPVECPLRVDIREQEAAPKEMCSLDVLRELQKRPPAEVQGCGRERPNHKTWL